MVETPLPKLGGLPSTWFILLEMNRLREIIWDSRGSFHNLCTINFQEANFHIQSWPNDEEFEEMVEN